MRGAPKLFSMTTLRPLGPSVTLTAFASVSTPRSMRSRAPDANLTSFAAIASTPFYVLPECSRDEGGRSGRLLDRHDVVEIGRAPVRTPVTNAHLVCRLLLETKQR